MGRKKNKNIGPPRIPPELFESVVKHLRSSPSALKTCSLVSSQFNTHTRTHLFRKLTITTYNVKPLLKIFTSSRCTISSSVRVLSLELYFDVWDRRTDNTIYTLSTHLTRVEKLSVLRCMWHHDSKAGQAFVSGFKEVKQLRIRDSFFWNSEHLSYVLASFPVLESLSLWSCKDMCLWGGPRTKPHAKGPLALSQEYLIPKGICDMEVISCGRLYWELLSSSTHLTYIRRLDLACHQKYGDLGHAKTLIATAGPALEDLRISIVFSSERKYQHTLTLEHNTHLRSLRVGFPSGIGARDPDERDLFRSWMSNVLSSIPSSSSSLIHLTLEVDEDLDPHAIIFFWSQLGIVEVLSTEPYRNLERLTVAITADTRVDVIGPDGVDGLKEKIRNLFKDCAFEKRGIVLDVLVDEEELHYSTITGGLQTTTPAVILM